MTATSIFTHLLNSEKNGCFITPYLFCLPVSESSTTLFEFRCSLVQLVYSYFPSIGVIGLSLFRNIVKIQFKRFGSKSLLSLPNYIMRE